MIQQCTRIGEEPDTARSLHAIVQNSSCGTHANSTLRMKPQGFDEFTLEFRDMQPKG